MFKHRALLNIRPGCQFTLSGDELIWNDRPNLKPSEKEIADECARLEMERIKNQYKEDRSKEYPSIGDQLDSLFKAGLFPEEMAAKIQAVKDKYKKPE